MALAPTVVLGGTAEGNPAGTLANPCQQMGGTVLEYVPGIDSQSVPQLQASGPSTSFYQTVNLFIGEICRVYGMRPLGAIQRIGDIIGNMKEQTYQ